MPWISGSRARCNGQAEDLTDTFPKRTASVVEIEGLYVDIQHFNVETSSEGTYEGGGQGLGRIHLRHYRVTSHTTGKADVQSCSENATGHRVQSPVRCSDPR